MNKIDRYLLSLIGRCTDEAEKETQAHILLSLASESSLIMEISESGIVACSEIGKIKIKKSHEHLLQQIMKFELDNTN